MLCSFLLMPLKATIHEANGMGDVLLIDATCVPCNRLGKFMSKRLSKRTSLEIYGIEEDRGRELVAGLQPSLQQADTMYLIRSQTSTNICATRFLPGQPNFENLKPSGQPDFINIFRPL